MANIDDILTNTEEDSYIVIDETFRTMSIPYSISIAGVFNDSNINTLKFKIPRYYNDNDLSEFTIKINYTRSDSISSFTYTTNKSFDNDYLYFDWLIDPFATKVAGILQFVVCMFKTNLNGEVIQEFNTTIANVEILEGIEVDTLPYETVAIDIVSKMETRLSNYTDSVKASIPQDYSTLSDKVNDYRNYYFPLLSIDNSYLDFNFKDNQIKIVGTLYFLGFGRTIVLTNQVIDITDMNQLVYDKETESLKAIYRAADYTNDFLRIGFWSSKGYWFNTNSLAVNGIIVNNQNNLFPTKRKIAFLGDSLTYGECGDGTTYPDVVGEILNATVENLGVSGATIITSANTILDQLSNISTDCDTICVSGGTNDFWKNVTLGELGSTDTSTFYGALEHIAKYLFTNYVGKKFVMLTPTRSYRTSSDYPTKTPYPYPTNSNGNTIEEFDKAIKDVAAKYSIPVIDLKSNSGITPFISACRTKYYADGVHLNAAGYRKIGEYVADKI